MISARTSPFPGSSGSPLITALLFRCGVRARATSTGGSPSSRPSCWTGSPPGSATSTTTTTTRPAGGQPRPGTAGLTTPSVWRQTYEPPWVPGPNSSWISGRLTKKPRAVSRIKRGRSRACRAVIARQRARLDPRSAAGWLRACEALAAAADRKDCCRAPGRQKETAARCACAPRQTRERLRGVEFPRFEVEPY